MIDFIASQRATFLITAELSPAAGRAALEDCLYAWQGKVDRYYCGPRFAKPHRKDLRMQGVVVFECRGGYHHAHLVVREPVRASPFHFQFHAPVWWREIAPTGKMHVQPIQQTAEDLTNVASYVAKDLNWTQWTDLAGDLWKFLDHLTRRQVLMT